MLTEGKMRGNLKDISSLMKPVAPPPSRKKENKLRIEWTSDEFECGCCGGSYAEGADIYYNDELVIKLEPIAHCYGGQHYDTGQVYEEIIKFLCSKLNTKVEGMLCVW